MFLRISSFISLLGFLTYIAFIATHGHPILTGLFWLTIWTAQSVAVLVYEFVWSRI